MKIDDIKKALVVGLGYRTGLSTSNFFASKGIDVTVSDIKGSDELMDTLKKLHGSVKQVLGRQEPSMLGEGYSHIILSPGVPRTIPLIAEAERKGIPVISEIELAFMVLRGRIIGVTGTDGKTTTTSLTGHLLKDLGMKVFVGGNIGTPLISFAEETSDDSVTVAELSSFQLETIDSFRPDAAAILNITPDHLDRYRSMEDYAAAKFRIAMNQEDSDYFIFNGDDAFIAGGLRGIRSGKLSFSLSDRSAGAYFENNGIYMKNKKGTVRVLDTPRLAIMGVHNIQNAMAAILMACSILEKMKVEPDFQSIAKSIYSFRPLEHRMERIGEYEGRVFINDSKATTIGAVEMALRGLTGNGILIIGGRTKGDDYSRLTPALKGAVKSLVLIGESREAFSSLFNGFSHVLADSLDDAAVQAMKLSSRGDVILLSPACASFDMFKSYEERGKVFKESFIKLKEGKLNWT